MKYVVWYVLSDISITRAYCSHDSDVLKDMHFEQCCITQCYAMLYLILQMRALSNNIHCHTSINNNIISNSVTTFYSRSLLSEMSQIYQIIIINYFDGFM